MRLKKLEQVLAGKAVPDVSRVMAYRVMRKPSDWSVGERELFAAFVSRTNSCPF